MKSSNIPNLLSIHFFFGIALALVCLCMMHPIQALLGVKIKVVYSLSVFFLVFLGLYQAKFRIQKNIYLIGFAIILSGCLGTMFSGHPHQLLVGFAGASSFIAAHYLATNALQMNGFVKGLVLFDYILLAGSIIAFLYIFFGGQLVGILVNTETSQPLFFFLSAFTNSCHLSATPFSFLHSINHCQVIADSLDLTLYIRPAGLFDEPGSLVMFNILVVCLNQVVLKNTVTSYRLLLLGLISFSFMAVIAIILFTAIQLFFSRNLYFSLLKVIIGLSFVVMICYFLFDPVNIIFFKRLYSEGGGFLVGENRMSQVLAIIQNMDTRIFFSGNHGQPKVFEGQVEANPLTLLYESGIMIWLGYVITLCTLIKMSFHENPDVIFSCLVIVLLLLQRPYIWSMYWSIFIWATIIVIYRFSHLMAQNPPCLNLARSKDSE